MVGLSFHLVFVNLLWRDRDNVAPRDLDRAYCFVSVQPSYYFDYIRLIGRLTQAQGSKNNKLAGLDESRIYFSALKDRVKTWSNISHERRTYWMVHTSVHHVKPTPNVVCICNVPYIRYIAIVMRLRISTVLQVTEIVGILAIGTCQQWGRLWKLKLIV